MGSHDLHQSSAGSSMRRSSGHGHDEHRAKTDYLCHVQYTNNLPDIPFDAKFLPCPFVSLNRLVEYKPTALEKNFKWELLTAPDLGVRIDLINPETYFIDPHMQKRAHDPVDQMLLEDEETYNQNSRRSQQHSKIVPWMRKTEYISSEFQRFGVAADRQETKVGYNIKKKLKEDFTYRDRASQIEAIRKTFDDVSKPLHEHPNKKGVKVLEELPLLPDFDNWIHPFALVVFDGDPIPRNEKTDGDVLLSQALIRGMMDERGEQFVTYYLPTKETLEARARDAQNEKPFDPDYTYEYTSVRDYNWLVRNKSTKGFEQDNYLFSVRSDGVYYDELETKVTLTRRKTVKAQVQQKSILYLHHRPYDDNELSIQRDRLNRLLHPYDANDDDGSEKDSSAEENGEEDGDEDDAASGEAENSPKNEEQDETKSNSSGDSEKEEKEESSNESEEQRSQASGDTDKEDGGALDSDGQDDEDGPKSDSSDSD
uniref:RNA polymerase II-associated factor 1 homolog n=1 Tax=Syphacia muris TaxID=451379 RepID=A0A0N5AUU3_9BILA